MRRLVTALVAGALCVLLAAPAAVGKENVRARIDSAVPLHAAPGKQIRIAWTLSFTERGSRHPFGASGVFVRLLSSSGGEPVKAPGHKRATGGFVAEVTVPEGGIRRITIGLEGIRLIGGRSENADVLFPVDNDPFAAADRAAKHARDSRSSAPSPSGDQPLPIWLAAAGALAVLGAGIALNRTVLSRRQRGGRPA
jgi:hypothetical protein